MHVLKRPAALAAAAVLSVALAACGTTSNGGEVSAQSLASQVAYNPQPYDNIRDGGTLTTSLPELTPQFNNWQSDGATVDGAQVWSWYNPDLITFTADGKAVFDPDYLTDVKQETVDGNTRVTYTINPKAVYNDGTPIDWTSFDAVWKADRGTDPAYLVASTDGYDRVSSLTPGVNSRQVVVTFRGINLWWQNLFGSLLHPKALSPAVFNQGYIDNPHPEWGAGPYTISKFDQQNGIITFERNPRWWGRKGKLDSRTFVVMEDSAALNAFKNGQIDAVSAGTKDRLAQLSGQPGTEIRKSTSLQVDYFTLNGTSPVLSDVQVRKAVLEAIDRNEITKVQLQGLGYTTAPAGSLILLPFQDGYQDDFGKVIRFDPRQAEKDLDAAGWTPGPDGVRAKNGKPLEFSYVNTGDDPIGKAIAGATAAMLKNVGIKLDIRQVPSSDFSKIITGQQFDMFYSGAVDGSPFGIAQICQLYCSDTQFLKSGVNSPANDALVRSVNTLPTAQQQYARASEAEIATFRTYGVMPTVNLPEIDAVRTGLANYGPGRYFSTTPENIGWQK
ncbi:ABC transporter family substrate-binding protein [Pseudonocardia xinjiangensis]|uniref:ABC transporter family substrate-binding protein n=1 Tax=Pseudonocardia xinjiangensis TaxID=75289 RepID=A0ABX1R9V8_9PSEU|nr:ABC transporter family substrate-binding protein [Pseudonocardia xinjiangensis]NMH76439.1 ABC transporter family substrate-binding protein [Pseudonocardia xinjiangensis]